MNYWFTSDTHWGHANIMKYCNRPFASLQEMNETMIANWNAVVRNSDTVYHLGDFAFLRETNAVDAILKRLQGQIKLIRGNHDHEPVYKAKGFQRVFEKYQGVMAKIGDELIYLNHFPQLTWDKSHYGVRHLFGHHHGSLPAERVPLNAMDVGVDANGFTPVNYDQLPKLVDVEERRKRIL